MSSPAQSKLFQPIRLGDKTLQHRVAMAPLTRYRSPNHVPADMVATYYGQRASKGGLLITEATFISEEAGGFEGVPGIYTDEHIQAWRKVTDAVHEKEGVIYMQLWNIGRANDGKADVKRVVSSSNLPFEGGATPEPLTVEEIERHVKAYGQAAKNATEAGFDGVEIHSANGYLLQQFLDAGCNKRTDKYGGSIENRTRFTKAVIDEVVSAIGAQRTSIRFSPWTSFQGMGTAESTSELIAVYLNLCNYIKSQHPQFAAVHITEDSDVWRQLEVKTEPRSNDPFRAVFRDSSNTVNHTAEKISSAKPIDEKFSEPTKENPTLFISCGGYSSKSATQVAEAKGAELIAFGRYFISNPDLPERIKNGQDFTHYDRSTFYKKYSTDGYLDYEVFGKEGHGERVQKEKAEKEKAKI